MFSLVLQYSDLRLKTDISDISNALELVQQLQGKSYLWKSDAVGTGSSSSSADEEHQTSLELGSNPSAHRAIGFIAQDVQRILPELVKEDPISGYLSVSYAEMVPILIEAFKQFLKEFSEGRAELARLEQRRYAQLSELCAALKQVHETVRVSNSAAVAAARHRADSTDSNSSSASATDSVQLILPPSLAGSTVSVSSGSRDTRKKKLKRRASSASSKVAVSIKPPPTISTKLILAISVVTLVVVLVATGVVVGVVLGRPQLPSMPSFAWATNNTVSDPGFEAPDPTDRTRASNWRGSYTLQEYSSLNNTPASLQQATFDKGTYGVQMSRTDSSGNFSDCTQSVDLMAVLAPRLAEFEAGTAVYGNATLSMWTFISPRVSFTPTGALTASVTLFGHEDDPTPIWYAETHRSSTESPGEWVQLNLVVPLPLAASSLGRVDLSFVSTFSPSELLAFVDAVSLTFQFRTNVPLPPVTVATFPVPPSPPILNPSELSGFSISTITTNDSWVTPVVAGTGSSIPRILSFAAAKAAGYGEAADLDFVPAMVLQTGKNITTAFTAALPYQIAAGRNYTVSFAVSISTYNNQSAGVIDYNQTELRLSIRKAPEYWVANYDSTSSTQLLEAPVITFRGSDTLTTVSYTFLLPAPTLVMGPVIGLNLKTVSKTSAPVYARLAVGSMTIDAGPVADPDRPPAGVLPSEIVVIPVQSDTPEINPRVDCPHLQPDLVVWDSLSLFGVPDSLGRVRIRENTKVLVNSMSIPTFVQEIYVPSTSELIFDDGPIRISLRLLRVDGALRIGSSTCRLFSQIQVIFTGSIVPGGSSEFGLLAQPGSTIDIFGVQFAPTWTRLRVTALPGSDRIYLQHNVNWRVGQTVALGTSFVYHSKMDFHEKAVIRAVQGNVVQFTAPLRFQHYANSRYQTEVALLSRQILFTTDPSAAAKNIGASFLASGPGTTVRLSGVEFSRMGALNQYNAYPVGLHFLGNESGSLITDCSVHTTYYRGIVVRGTSKIVLDRNVVYNFAYVPFVPNQQTFTNLGLFVVVMESL